MSESEWLHHKDKSKKKIFWVIGIVVVICIIIGVFIRNNSEILLTNKIDLLQTVHSNADFKKDTVKAIEGLIESTNSKKQLDLQYGEGIKRPEQKPSSLDLTKPPISVASKIAVRDSVVSAPMSGNESVLVGDIACKLIDPSTPILRVSLLLFFKENASLRQEILLKRDNIKVMVQKTLSTKSLDDIAVDVLRKGLLTGCNALMEHGKIVDIEFKEFRIDKVE